jgi:hypothetical protein
MILLKGNQQHPLPGSQELLSLLAITDFDFVSGTPHCALAKQSVALVIN